MGNWEDKGKVFVATKVKSRCIQYNAIIQTLYNYVDQVFLRYYHVEQLNLLLREVIARVVVMQAYTKGWIGAQRYRKQKEKRNHGAIIIQSGTTTNCKRQMMQMKSIILDYNNNETGANLL